MVTLKIIRKWVVGKKQFEVVEKRYGEPEPEPEPSY